MNREISPLTTELSPEFPPISVIIPLYNKAEFLREAFESVVNQGYPNLEILIRDDGSSDLSLSVANQLKSDYPQINFSIFQGENRGASFTRNFLIEKASSRLIMLMDADDIMLPGFLSEAIQEMRARGAHVVYSDVKVIGVADKEWCPPVFDRYLIRYDNCLTSLALIDKELWQAVGGYDTGLPFNEDWSFFINVAQLSDKFYKIPKKYFCYRHTHTGLYYSYILDNWSLNLALVMLANPDLYAAEEVLVAVDNLSLAPENWMNKFSDLGAKNPDAVFPNLALGILETYKGNLQTAVNYFSKAIEKGGGQNWLVLYLLAKLIKTSNTSACIELLHKARSLRPDIAPKANLIIKELLGQGDEIASREAEKLDSHSLERPPSLSQVSFDLGINEAALEYWRLKGYTKDEVDQLCKELDSDYMVARVSFFGQGEFKIAISNRTWQRQEGHYPTICDFFTDVAKTDACRDLEGSLVVWLEDGMWEHVNHLSSRVPILNFGRHIYDKKSFLMPDPSFLGFNGYLEDKEAMLDFKVKYRAKTRKRTVFWRGAASGIGIEGAEWENTARGRLCLLSQSLGNPEILDARMTRYKHLPREQVQCLESNGVIEEKACDFEHFLNYMYLIDADGYCCAWQSLFLKLMSSSLTLKIQSPYEQWFGRELKPWKHYIPLNPDLKELVEIYEWLIRNDDKVEEIISAANAFTNSLTYQGEVKRTSEIVRGILECQRG